MLNFMTTGLLFISMLLMESSCNLCLFIVKLYRNVKNMMASLLQYWLKHGRRDQDITNCTNTIIEKWLKFSEAIEEKIWIRLLSNLFKDLTPMLYLPSVFLFTKFVHTKLLSAFLSSIRNYCQCSYTKFFHTKFILEAFVKSSHCVEFLK